MEYKTKIHAEEGRQDLLITRDFDLPLKLLFKAYEDPELLEQWMGTKVIRLENHTMGSWEFQTSDSNGIIMFHAWGTIHEFKPNERIIRTFEMQNADFTAQLEFLEFEKISDERSRLQMHIIYRSVAYRDQQLKLPFAFGLNMAHDRLEEVCKVKSKK